jgi:hypothetical protein
LLFCLGFFLINPFSISIATDVAGLIPCSQSSVYTKKLNSSITKLENRMKKYEENSPPTLALEKQIENTKKDLINMLNLAYFVEMMDYHI